MPHIAKVGVRPAFVVANDVSVQVGYLVDDVRSGDADYVASLIDTSPGRWVQTSYNTLGGKNSTSAPPVRGNYAGIDFIHDTVNDVFYPQQPYPSWTISAPTWTWTPPTPMPTDGKQYRWDEPSKSWVVLTAKTGG